jgi:triosephosphate isomerase
LRGLIEVRRRLVAGNWKMHGSSATIERLLDALIPLNLAQTEVVLFPPVAYLSVVVERVKGSAIAVGAQNIHAESSGAFTGEVAAEMVKDLGATYVLVGHSERRRLFGETDAIVAQKYAAALRAGLVPILCVGETLLDRDAGRAEHVVMTQLDAVTQTSGVTTLRQAMIAYEPVWAIGTGRSATPADAQLMHGAIRARIRTMDATVAEGLPILYGGSITDGNAAAIFAGADVDGGLVGGASLNAGQFVNICKAA